MADMLISGSPAMAGLLGKLDRLAAMDAKTSSPCNVVISGETGSGKDLVARRIHEMSGRGEAPFVAINCSAVPEELFESELFGHERGAFTGAVLLKKGLLEQAGGGTLFLDEAADLPIGLQVKLLRALQNRVIRRVGGLKDIEIDVRVIVASNRDLAVLVERGQFRRDLYYRLNVFPVSVPPLRERREDIPALAERFCGAYAAKYGVPAKRLSAEAVEALCRHDWPGNVRELEHVIECAFILAEGDEMGLGHLPEKLVGTAAVPSQPVPPSCADLGAWIDGLPADAMMADVSARLREAKSMFCRRRLEEHGGNIARASNAVGLNRKSFYRLLKALPGDPDPVDDET